MSGLIFGAACTFKVMVGPCLGPQALNAPQRSPAAAVAFVLPRPSGRLTAGPGSTSAGVGSACAGVVFDVNLSIGNWTKTLDKSGPPGRYVSECLGNQWEHGSLASRHCGRPPRSSYLLAITSVRSSVLAVQWVHREAIKWK